MVGGRNSFCRNVQESILLATRKDPPKLTYKAAIFRLTSIFVLVKCKVKLRPYCLSVRYEC